MISADDIPRRYRTLPGARRVLKDLNRPVDLAITVDCSAREMLGKTYDSFMAAGEMLEIDHHEFRRPFGTASLVDVNAAAVGEIIYALLKELKVRMTKPIAQNLMTSIVVETNSFKLPNVRRATFEVCADLIKCGVDFYRLVNTVFWSKDRASAVLSGICLARCRFLRGGAVAWSIITNKDFKLSHGKSDDVDAVPDEMRAIDGVRVVVLFRETAGNALRVSLRSKGRINVASVAEYYNGGGHFDVAGCIIKNDPASIRGLLRRVERLVR
jgi:phosphoesterase RecJ-like protein